LKNTLEIIVVPPIRLSMADGLEIQDYRVNVGIVA